MASLDPFSSFIFLIMSSSSTLDVNQWQSINISPQPPFQMFPNIPLLYLLGAAKAYIYTIRVDSKSLNSNHPNVMPCNIDIVCYAFNILLTIAKLPSPCFFKVCNMLFECLNRIHIFQQTVLCQIFFLLQHVTTNLTSCNGIEHKWPIKSQFKLHTSIKNL